MYEFSIKAKKKFLTKFLYKWLTFFSLYFADIYSVSSECDKKFLQKNFNKQSHNLVVRPNWVKEVMVTDLDIFSLRKMSNLEVNLLIFFGL